jgi:hypothetical protein
MSGIRFVCYFVAMYVNENKSNDEIYAAGRGQVSKRHFHNYDAGTINTKISPNSLFSFHFNFGHSIYNIPYL